MSKHSVYPRFVDLFLPSFHLCPAGALSCRDAPATGCRHTPPFWTCATGASTASTRLSFRLRPSADERESALERLSRFVAWANTVPEMAGSAHNNDKLLAVAQHYGIPTNYMDFTTEPRIAGFFAADALPEDLRGDEPSCLICVNGGDLHEFWKSVQFARPEWPVPQIIRVHIAELWRLQAQRGRFIFLPYDDFERIYDFDRIYFPLHRGQPPVPKDDVYPRQKSELEIAIDRFFMLERMASNKELLDACEIVRMEAPPEGIEKDCFGPDGLPPHQSWANARGGCWAQPAPESWTEYSKAPTWPIELQLTGNQQVKHLAETIVQRLRGEPSLRGGPVIWRCEGVPQIADSLGLFWDGTRRWPYTIDDIAWGLALTAVFAALVGRSEAPLSYADVAESFAESCLGEECVEVEIGMSDNSYTRGFVRASEVQKAIRSDFSAWLQESRRPQITNIRSVIQVAQVPECVFDFDVLTRIFVREIVPTQVVLRGERSGKARMYNIARAATFGLP